MSAFTHPAFAPYRELIAETADRGLAALNAAAEVRGLRYAASGLPLRFSSAVQADSAAQYEMSIAESGLVPTREDNLHDYFNALVWLRFPLLKSAITQRHCQTLAINPSERRQRGSLRDHLTLLDESGALVISPRDDLLDLLRGKHWVELFWNARAQVVQDMQFVVVGHGLLEKCLAPFPGMTAKCLLLRTRERDLASIDQLAAERIEFAESVDLPPLPVQGIPGWAENGAEAYYRNTEVFRPARRPAQDLPPQTRS